MRNIFMESNQTNRALIKATVIALSVAVVSLVLFILPAEYDIDPTGVGKKLGLTVFNQDGESPSAKTSTDGDQDTVVVTVPAGKGIEYKLSMMESQQVTYEWQTSNGELYVDLHGEPDGDNTGYFKSYTVATVESMKGSFVVPFNGSHGWYWKNNTDKDIDVQLIFSGEYIVEGLK
tara:strand:+ start:7545 stop:8072 length:528 start_codon:yes stop_codon:yes gene_type:complete